MEKETMIQALQQKFTPSALEQMVSLERKDTFNIEVLTYEEVAKLYFRFFPKPKTTQEINELLFQELELKKLRSIILADAQYMGLYSPNNWLVFNGFMKNRSVLKKPLNEYSIQEMPLLIKQFKSMKTKYIKANIQVYSRQWYEYFQILIKK